VEFLEEKRPFEWKWKREWRFLGFPAAWTTAISGSKRLLPSGPRARRKAASLIAGRARSVGVELGGGGFAEEVGRRWAENGSAASLSVLSKVVSPSP
jgi:hypothetical protein